MTPAEKRDRFRALHRGQDLFVMPNPWDLGSACILEKVGFPALATTSSGFAISYGRTDGEIRFDELVDHSRALAAAVDIPVSVDAERLFSEDLAGVQANVRKLAGTGVAGCSIEDWAPEHGIDPIESATERVAAAAEAAREAGLVLTARAEGLLRGQGTLDEIITRLRAYRDAGAECVYAPTLASEEDITRVVNEAEIAVNVLIRPNTPTIARMAELGVRRLSTGGALARAAYGGLEEAARALLPG